MADKRVIAVVGSTGAQGGGLCRAILAEQSGAFACRAITRDPGKDQALVLVAAGADVVRADMFRERPRWRDDPQTPRARPFTV